jgi:plasmid stability protein
MATLTLRNVDDELLERLKAATENSTASKALIDAARLYLVNSVAIEDYKDDIRDLKEQNELLRQRIESARDSARLLLEHIDQGDLF